MRICTRVEEKESKEAEMQFFDPLVSELARDDKLVEANKMMLITSVCGQEERRGGSHRLGCPGV